MKNKFNTLVSSFVEQLEAGVAPWIRPYAIGNRTSHVPRNFSTKKPYRGINVLLLWLTSDLMGYTSNMWLTYKHAQALGGSVRASSKAAKIFFWSPLVEREHGQKEDIQHDEEVRTWVMRLYSVFNLDQISGLRAVEEPVALLNDKQALNHRLEVFVRNTGAVIRDGGIPAYVPTRDIIEIPCVSLFTSSEDYYATLLHELVHWTGSKHRLNRLVPCKFGDAAYGMEELVAELGAVFVSSFFDLPVERAGHPEYLGYWAKAISEKPAILWKAASKAQASVDYLMRLTGAEAYAEAEDVAEAVCA